MWGFFFQTQRSIVQINKKGSLSGNKKRQIFGFKTRQREKESKGENKKERITICDFQSSWWIFKPLGERVIFFVERGGEKTVLLGTIFLLPEKN